jgi:hypothetical protein
MQDIINSVHKVTYPYFTLEIRDVYGDRGSAIMPTIEELTVLHFKLRCNCCNSSIKSIIISKEKRKEILDAVNELNVGTAEYWNCGVMGQYIVVTPYADDYLLK